MTVHKVFLGDGPHRSGPLTPDPKKPFNWTRFWNAAMGAGIAMIVIILGHRLFVQIVGGHEEYLNSEARAAGRCRTFCETEHWQYWSHRSIEGEDLQECSCTQITRRVNHNFLCNYATEPMLCIYR